MNNFKKIYGLIISNLKKLSVIYKKEQSFYTNKPDINKWLNKYKITNYKLIEDHKYGYVVDVDSSVDLSYRDFRYIPIKFNNVSDYFDCSDNLLTSLEFCPTTIGAGFSCSNNNLTSLAGCPTTIGGSFYCNYNSLTSLEFCPETVYDNFYCDDNSLTSLQFCPHTVKGDFYCRNTELSSLQFSPKIIGGTFSCNDNNLTSLEFCPETVGGDFYCNDNKIADLIHFPNHINGNIYLGKNNLTKIGMRRSKSYNFAELYPIHLEHRITAEKELLDNSISKNLGHDSKKILDRRNNKLKI